MEDMQSPIRQDAVYESHPRAAEARKILLDSIAGAPLDACAILLSGGLDTSIIAEGTSGRTFQHGITVSCGSDLENPMHDLAYATAIAKRMNMKYHVISIPDPMDILNTSTDGALHLTIRILETFDPMEIRGGVAVTRALLHAKSVGIKAVLTGDGADEMFAGYSFLINQPSEKLQAWRERAAKHMQFCATKIGNALDISVYQPFIQPDVISFALSCSKEDLVSHHDSKDHGKFVLRAAFPEAYSRWRAKVPLESGAGTSLVGNLFKEMANAEFEALKEKIYQEDGIVIRDPEHLHYYNVFRSIFATTTPQNNSNPADGTASSGNGTTSWTCQVARFDTDPCIQCGFQLERPEQYFCKTCGAWPARASGPPA